MESFTLIALQVKIPSDITMTEMDVLERTESDSEESDQVEVDSDDEVRLRLLVLPNPGNLNTGY